MSWIYYSQVFEPEMIPEGAIGFVYEMSAFINGKSLSYIGKKNFHSNTKKKLSKKAMPTDKRKKGYVKVTKLAYEDYYSSNQVLKTAHKKGILIHRNILKICYSKTELTYNEVKFQFAYKVLESDFYLNGNILGRFYKQKNNGKN
jgi:hypothetical protein